VNAHVEASPPVPVAVASTPPAELRVVEEPGTPAAGLRGWHLAFVVGVLLAVAAVVLALLAVTGAVNVP
jgi:hypothetical protein